MNWFLNIRPTGLVDRLQAVLQESALSVAGSGQADVLSAGGGGAPEERAGQPGECGGVAGGNPALPRAGDEGRCPATANNCWATTGDGSASQHLNIKHTRGTTSIVIKVEHHMKLLVEIK